MSDLVGNHIVSHEAAQLVTITFNSTEVASAREHLLWVTRRNHCGVQ